MTPSDRIVLRRRPVGVAGGAKRARIREIQAELLAELQEIDAEVQRLVDRRSIVVDGLHRCRDAISGPETPHVKRDPLPRDLDTEPRGTVELRGNELRDAIRHVLRAAGRPLTLGEVRRGLLARGLRPPGRASKTISDALAVEVRQGRAERLRRGEFAAAGCAV